MSKVTSCDFDCKKFPSANMLKTDFRQEDQKEVVKIDEVSILVDIHTF